MANQPAGDARAPDDQVAVPGNELTDRNIRTIVELERASKATSAGERVAVHVAAFCGSMTFIWIHVALFSAWVVFNTLSVHRLDRFPFPLLTFVVSLEAIFLSAFILISQNQETRLSEQRSHLDLQVNLLSEQENTEMLKILRSIAKKIGAEFDEHPDLATMEQATRPENLVDQIDKAIEQAAQRQNS